MAVAAAVADAAAAWHDHQHIVTHTYTLANVAQVVLVAARDFYSGSLLRLFLSLCSCSATYSFSSTLAVRVFLI